MKRIRVDRLNIKINNIIKNGYRPITDFSHVKQNYNWIIKPHGRRNSHLVMTYAEAKKELAKRFPNEPLTRKEYDEQLLAFTTDFSDRLTVYGEKRYQREYMISVIQDHHEDEGLKSINFNRISTNKLRDAFIHARKIVEESSGKSPQFYYFIDEYLNKMR